MSEWIKIFFSFFLRGGGGSDWGKIYIFACHIILGISGWEPWDENAWKIASWRLCSCCFPFRSAGLLFLLPCVNSPSHFLRAPAADTLPPRVFPTALPHAFVASESCSLNLFLAWVDREVLGALGPKSICLPEPLYLILKLDFYHRHPNAWFLLINNFLKDILLPVFSNVCCMSTAAVLGGCS